MIAAHGGSARTSEAWSFRIEGKTFVLISPENSSATFVLARMIRQVALTPPRLETEASRSRVGDAVAR